VVDGNHAYVCHSEENIDSSVLGRVVCIDASKRGDVTKDGEVWRSDRRTAGYASPAIANGRLYVVTNSANMICLDAKTGKPHWEYTLGRVMKGSPAVTADGIIYAGTVNGRFLILEDANDHCELLDLELFTADDKSVVEINGAPAISNGRRRWIWPGCSPPPNTAGGETTSATRYSVTCPLQTGSAFLLPVRAARDTAMSSTLSYRWTGKSCTY
jgi:hypothetical protein